MIFVKIFNFWIFLVGQNVFIEENIIYNYINIFDFNVYVLFF